MLKLLLSVILGLLLFGIIGAVTIIFIITHTKNA